MNWKDRYLDASFRDASFAVESHAYSGGRRTAVHEFPGAEHSFAEDLGQKAREFTVEAFVFGPDYDGRRDALRAALEQPGPGMLVHPYLGGMRVQVAAVAMRESTEQGGCARFSITFEEARLATATMLPDTAGLLKTASGFSIANVCSAFRRLAHYAALPGAFVAELEQNLGNLLSAAESVVKGVTDSAVALILAPSDLATALSGSLARIQSLAGSPERAFGIYRKLWAAKATRPNQQPAVQPIDTADRRTQAAARAALTALVQQLAVALAAASLADTTFGSATQALAMRDALAAALDDRMLTAADEVYESFRALRAALAADVAARGAGLPRVVSYTPPATMPVLLLAQLLYGDATRAGDIVARNPILIRHPGFVTGGQALEVLSDP